MTEKTVEAKVKIPLALHQRMMIAKMMDVEPNKQAIILKALEEYLDKREAAQREV